MIVATAGHIDHGKTALVKALTGVDTDRLPEEKARGISIDLGFAYWATPGGGTIGFVDVPGHERFVRNMLAGVCAIDYVVLAIAADDGVMPQTLEHLQIMDLLGISRGIAVITKTDRVSPARVAEVSANARALLAGTSLADIDVLPVSAPQGLGIPVLRNMLVSASAEQTQRAGAGRFRYAVDRAFTVAGSGTVVTGTVFDGAVSAGQKLVLSPSGIEVRVRAVHQYDRAVAEARAGQRFALNLAGVELGQVRRGDWVLDPALHAPTSCIDVRLRVLAAEKRPLRHWTPVHMHLGTCEVVARVAIQRGAIVQPGESGLAQLVLDRPIATLRNDRFIVRDQSAVRTVGGGFVVNPFATRCRRTAQRAAQLEALQLESPEAALGALCACTPGGTDIVQFERSFNLAPGRLATLMERLALVALGKDPLLAFPQEAIRALHRDVVKTVGEFHASHSRSPGIPANALRTQCAATLRPDTFNALVRSLASEGVLELAGSAIRLPAHRDGYSSIDEATWQRLRPVLEDAGLRGISIANVVDQTRLKIAIVRDLMHARTRAGTLVQITRDRFSLRGPVDAFAAEVVKVAAASPGGRFTAASVRDRTGLGRQLVIELLESLDRIGVTRRIDDVRILRSAAAASPHSTHESNEHHADQAV